MLRRPLHYFRFDCTGDSLHDLDEGWVTQSTERNGVKRKKKIELCVHKRGDIRRYEINNGVRDKRSAGYDSLLKNCSWYMTKSRKTDSCSHYFYYIKIILSFFRLLEYFFVFIVVRFLYLNSVKYKVYR